MANFIRVRDTVIDECYIAKVTADCIYYGHTIPGHENRQATAVMTKEYFNKLVDLKGLSDNFIIGEVIL